MASNTGKIAPPAYPNTVSTLCLSIISWKISPPVNPMNESSINCSFFFLEIAEDLCLLRVGSFMIG